MSLDGMAARIICWYHLHKSWWDTKPEEPHRWKLPRVTR